MCMLVNIVIGTRKDREREREREMDMTLRFTESMDWAMTQPSLLCF